MNERRSPRRTDSRSLLESGAAREAQARYRFAERFAVGAVVLVIGAGDGSGAARLAASARQVVALDPVPALVQRAARRYRRANLRFLVGGPTVDGLAAAAFDLVTAFARLDRVGDWPRFLDGVRLVLRPGGRLVVAVENAAWSHPDRLPVGLAVGPATFALAEFHDLLADRLAIEGLYGQSSAAKTLLTHTVDYVHAGATPSSLDLADRAAAVVGPATPASRYFVAVCRRR
jgi:SAM-dependent methyltransferase